MKTHSVVIVGNHALISHAIASLVNTFNDFNVQFICNSGYELIEKLKATSVKPEIILIDISMSQMSGLETTQYLTNNYSDINVIALIAIESNETILSMLKAGAKSYISKDINKKSLEKALHQVVKNGSYYSKSVIKTLISCITNNSHLQGEDLSIKKQEKEFMIYACSELTYKEIAERMYRSPKTIDGYRNNLFEKLNIKNRTGLVLYAIRNKFYKP